MVHNEWMDDMIRLADEIRQMVEIARESQANSISIDESFPPQIVIAKSIFDEIIQSKHNDVLVEGNGEGVVSTKSRELSVDEHKAFSMAIDALHLYIKTWTIPAGRVLQKQESALCLDTLRTPLGSDDESIPAEEVDDRETPSSGD